MKKKKKIPDDFQLKSLGMISIKHSKYISFLINVYLFNSVSIYLITDSIFKPVTNAIPVAIDGSSALKKIV